VPWVIGSYNPAHDNQMCLLLIDAIRRRPVPSGGDFLRGSRRPTQRAVPFQGPFDFQDRIATARWSSGGKRGRAASGGAGYGRRAEEGYGAADGDRPADGDWPADGDRAADGDRLPGGYEVADGDASSEGGGYGGGYEDSDGGGYEDSEGGGYGYEAGAAGGGPDRAAASDECSDRSHSRTLSSSASR
jgi:hypothetical protein